MKRRKMLLKDNHHMSIILSSYLSQLIQFNVGFNFTKSNFTLQRKGDKIKCYFQRKKCYFQRKKCYFQRKKCYFQRKKCYFQWKKMLFPKEKMLFSMEKNFISNGKNARKSIAFKLTSDCLRIKRGIGASVLILGLRRTNFDKSSIGNWTSAGRERRFEISCGSSFVRLLVLGLSWTLQLLLVDISHTNTPSMDVKKMGRKTCGSE